MCVCVLVWLASTINYAHVSTISYSFFKRCINTQWKLVCGSIYSSNKLFTIVFLSFLYGLASVSLCTIFCYCCCCLYRWYFMWLCLLDWIVDSTLMYNYDQISVYSMHSMGVVLWRTIQLIFLFRQSKQNFEIACLAYQIVNIMCSVRVHIVRSFDEFYTINYGKQTFYLYSSCAWLQTNQII